MPAADSVKHPVDTDWVSALGNLSEWALLASMLGLLVLSAKWWAGDVPGGLPQPASLQAAAVQTHRASTAGSASDTARNDTPTTAKASGAIGSTSEAAVEVAAPAAAVSLPPDIETIRAPRKTPYPRRTDSVEASVPDNAPVKRGIVILSVLIGPDGNVVNVELLRSVDPVLDASAVSAARRWKFEPTVYQGEPVAVLGNFTVPFGH